MITLKGKEGERTFLNKCVNAIDCVRNDAGYPEEIRVHTTNGEIHAYKAEPPSDNWTAYQEWLEQGEEGS